MISPVMDHTSIPPCALYRKTGTVIVRVKMDVASTCCQREECPVSSCPKAVHRPSGCELCSRTRLNSQYSDCDSDVVDECRPYSSSSARSRYVNVCAAVCLLLLVGGVVPRSSAAPHRSRAIMDRQRRAAEENGSTENSFWANPCDYNESYVKPVYSSNIVRTFVVQAKNTLSSAAHYKDAFAKELHSYSSFDKLLEMWVSYDWLKKFSWYREEMLPSEKVFNRTMPDEYVDGLVKEKIDEVMPAMYKGLKMIVASYYAFSREGLNDQIITDENLKKNITQTMHNMRAALCCFSDILRSRNLEILPVLDSEIPDFNSDDRLTVGLLLYRDSLNYLEYLTQVFQKFYDVESA